MHQNTDKGNRVRQIAVAAIAWLLIELAVPPDLANCQRRAWAQASDDAARKEDRAAVRAVMDSFVKAFQTRDAKALAAHWSAEGEYENDAGIIVHGREALEAAFTAFFAKTPDVQAEIRPEALRFLSSGAGIEEGSVTVRRGAAEATTRARYSALIVREGGQWFLASLRETSADGPSIGDLGWLIGEWKSEIGEGAEIRASYAWDANKKFIHVRFSLKEKQIERNGTQVIGVDPATGELHSWTFEADGGVGEADWHRDGDHWVLDAAGTLSDGSTLTETNVLRRINDDTVTWQSVERLLDDEEIPDLAPVKVTRVKPSR